MPRNHEDRKAQNEASRNRAENFREEWTATEHEVVLLWDGTEDTLTELAEMLGRTREACRQRFYELRSGKRPVSPDARRSPRAVTRTVTRTETVTTRVQWADDDEWPDWYVRG
jgi:hypothetical protein